MPQSVQCPRCQAAVSVSDDAGGSRVNCPACDQSFIVPGFSGGTGYPATSTAAGTGGFQASPPTTSDDADDWLGDDFPGLAPIKPKMSPYSMSATPPIDDVLEVDDVIEVDDVMEVDDVEVIEEDITGDDVTGNDVIGNDFADDDITAPMEPPPKKTVYAENIRVRCPHCGTQADVSAAKAGQMIKCRDCHSQIRVGQPMRVRQKAEMNSETAPTFQFSESAAQQERPKDPYRKSADELLAAASKVDKDESKPDLDTPKIRDWAFAVFGIFFQIGVMAHWLIMSAMASGIAFVVLAIDHPVLMVGLFAGGGMFAAVVLACGFAIMQSVANEEESVSEWPVTLEPMEWLAPTLFCFAAAAMALFPGWFVGYMAFGNSLTTVCLSMLSIFAIFPFVLLSMLDMQSIFIPFSPDVGRSVTRCEESWGGFYFSSAVIFVITFMVFAFVSPMAAPAKAVVSIFFAVGAAFVYFAMLGRLAYAIGQSVNSEPKENNINEIREAERKDSQT